MKPDIFTEMEKKLVAAVFGCLAENDPIVAPYVWESALHIVVNFAVSRFISKYESNI